MSIDAAPPAAATAASHTSSAPVKATTPLSKASTDPITTVSISGLALLKIIHHSNQILPNMGSGSLLGIDLGGGELEVSIHTN